MPLYVYKCNQCEHVFEELRKMNLSSSKDTTAFATCPECSGLGKKQISTVHFTINGFSEANGYSKKE